MVRNSILAAALLVATVSPARADDLSSFLAGRWGMTDTNWQPVAPNRANHSCDRVPGGPDTALSFSGPLGAIMVTSNARSGSSGPLSSRLTVGKAMKFDGNIHSGHLASSRLIVEVDFMRRGMFDTSTRVNGLLGIAGPDRFVISMPNDVFPMYFTRCPR